ncbi:hypothetical protein [Nocardia bhagyanarayanae]|uniref:hypothetical protein n=1 Tax=Nocardia bhagyanarayanae TaxID=1215925 RepID=UPI001FE2EE09|nr:hypothetical protein [Nocardia bhagyanarayanae]
MPTACTREGLITTDFQPVTLVVVLTDLVRAAVQAARADDPHCIAERRAAVVPAARRLVAP